jgi:hypothetical protein
MTGVKGTPAKNLLPVSLTPVKTPWLWFSLIAGVVFTSDKFIASQRNR